MNRIKKSALLLLLSFSMLISGCDKISTQGNDETSSDFTEIETIEPPENGWTLEQLNEVMYLNHDHLYMPCTLEDFNKKFEIQNNYPYQNENEKILTFDVLLDDNYVFGINCKNDITKKITAIAISQGLISTNIDSNDLIIINGFGLGDNIEELINTLGTPTSTTDISYSYTIRDTNINIIFIFSDLNKVTSIIIEDVEE